ncbi:MAG: glycosyltransferase family 2 protein, partial [Rhodanobacteraceae bacterium]
MRYVVVVDPQLSVILPVFNEGPVLASHLVSIAAWLDAEYGREAYELIVVDDGSSDASRAAIESLSHENTSIVAIAHTTNRGMNEAIRTGVARSTGSCLVIFDSDLTYETATIGRLVEALQRNGATIAMASPYMRGGACKAIPFVKRQLSRFANRFLSYAVRGRYHTMTGVVRAYRGPWLRAVLREKPVDATHGLFFTALHAREPIVEIPATLDWSGQPRGRARRVNPRATLRRIGQVFCAGVKARPAVLVGLPGLLPGVLPAVVFLAFLFHATAQTLAIATGVTIAIQYASLALLGLQVGDFYTNGVV